MFYPIMEGDKIIGYKLYPKPENLVEWHHEVCPECPYYYKNWENSTECMGTLLTIKKKCVFNKNNLKKDLTNR